MTREQGLQAHPLPPQAQPCRLDDAHLSTDTEAGVDVILEIDAVLLGLKMANAIIAATVGGFGVRSEGR